MHRGRFLVAMGACLALPACNTDGTLDVPGADLGLVPSTPDLATAVPDLGGERAVDLAEVIAPPGCTCAPAIPPGWSGPLLFAEVDGQSPPACPPGSLGEAFRGNAVLDARPGTCTCTCGAPHNLACYYSIVRVMTDNSACTCTPNACFAISPGDWPPGRCVTNGFKEPNGPVQSVSFDGFLNAYGTCDPGPRDPLPAWSWRRAAVACRQIAGVERCSDGRVCLTTPPPPFEATACIVRSGDVDCPGGAYRSKRTYYAGVADNRDCTACKCGAVTGASCSLTLEGFATPQCDIPTLSVKLATGVPLPGCTRNADARYFRMSNIAVAGGACMPAAGMPVGAATPTAPTTVCCMN